MVIIQYFKLKVCSFPSVLNRTGVESDIFKAGPLVNINSLISLDFLYLTAKKSCHILCANFLVVI